MIFDRTSRGLRTRSCDSRSGRRRGNTGREKRIESLGRIAGSETASAKSPDLTESAEPEKSRAETRAAKSTAAEAVPAEAAGAAARSLPRSLRERYVRWVRGIGIARIQRVPGRRIQRIELKQRSIERIFRRTVVAG